MIVIFEGPDNVGKTTQIRLLKEKMLDYKFLTMYCSAVRGADKYYYQECFTDLFRVFQFAMSTEISIICDRSHLGDYVYGQLYRKYNPNYIFEIENHFENAEKFFIEDIVLVLLLDTPSNLIEREDGFSFSEDLKQKQAEINLFKEAFHKSHIFHKIEINNNGRTTEEISKEIYEYISPLTKF